MANLEVLCSNAQQFQIAINPELLEAAKSGDRRKLDEVLQQYYPSGALGEEIAITIPEDAEIQRVTRCLFGVTPEGNTALHIVASRGHLELAEEICRRERSLLEVSNMRLDTPLHLAARAGHDNIVSLIIRFARDEEWIEARRVLRVRNMDKANALHEAAKYNHPSMATALIEEDVKLASMLNDVGMSPLYLAIVTGSRDVAKALLQSSSMQRASLASYAGPNEKTVLHAAVLLNPEIIKDMLQLKPMLTKCVDSLRRTPLHYAASDGHHDVVKLLLEHDPSAAYLSDADGLFPIHLAVSMGNKCTIEQILQQCPETCELLDKEGKNLLHFAFERRKLNMVKKIISERPDLRKMLNDRDKKGNTVLHTVVKNSDIQSVNFLLRDKTIDIDIVNYDGFTPFDLAYAKMDKDLHYALNADDYIVACLALSKAKPGPRQLHAFKRIKLCGDEAERKSSKEEKSSSYETEEMKKDLKISENFAIVSVLVATVTFAAGFTLPGGYLADGTAVLAKKYAFKVFLVSDAFAFIFSILATFWFVFAGVLIVDKHVRRLGLFWAMNALWVAIACMSISFGMGIRASLAPSCKRISLLLFIIALVTPLLTHSFGGFSVGIVAKTVIRREGYKQWFFPTVDPVARKRLSFLIWAICASLYPFLYPMLVVAVLFPLAML